jgi:hypothetical protein
MPVNTVYITEKGCDLLAIFPEVAAIARNLREGGTWYDTVTRIIPRMKIPEVHIVSTTEAELKRFREARAQKQQNKREEKIKKYSDALYADVAAMPHETRTMAALTEYIADSIAATVPTDMQDDVAVAVSDRAEANGLVYTPPLPPTPTTPPKQKARAHLNYRQRIIRYALETFRPEMYTDTADICIESVHMPEIVLTAQAPAPRQRAWESKFTLYDM